MPLSFGSFNAFERDSAVTSGRKGGRSKSKAKVKAARSNGKLGGRPSTRTLIERVLNRRVTPEEWKNIQTYVMRRILLGHQDFIPSYFECDWDDVPRKSWRGLPLQVRQSIRHLKAVTKIFLPKFRPKPPKDYVVIRVPKLPGRREAWERRHPDMPFVATEPQKVPFTSLFNYAWFDRKFANGVELDEADILRNGEGKITREQATALLKYLKFKYAKS